MITQVTRGLQRLQYQQEKEEWDVSLYDNTLIQQDEVQDQCLLLIMNIHRVGIVGQQRQQLQHENIMLQPVHYEVISDTL